MPQFGQRAVFFNLFSRRAFLALAVTILFLLAAFTAPRWPAGGSVSRLVFWLSLAGIAAGVIGRTWSILYIDGHKLFDLVTGGPYSISRNPLYLFSFFGAAGAGLASGSLTMGALALGLTYAVFYALVRQEETALLERHGEPYAAYCRAVPRFWPRLANWQGVEWVNIRPRKVVATFLEALVFAAAFPAFYLLQWAQSAGLIPVLLRLP